MLLSLENTSFGFGARQLLDDVNWQIYPGQKIGLIGLNGVGKSTLLKMLDGQFTPDAGQITKARNLKIGFLNQDSLSFDSNEPILKVAMSAFEDAQKAEEKLQVLADKLEKDSHNAELQKEYNDMLHLYEISGGYEYQHQSEIVLEGLGFPTHELQKPYSQFSGGWRMRVLLAKLILQNPDLLLLDEPTNHLDLPAIEWLEKYIQSYPGAIVIISHDKAFLNQMCTELVELDRQKLVSYKGDYDYYQTEKALREEHLLKEHANQQAYIKQQERFIERFKAKASKATQAKSVQKKLDKIERIELAPNSSDGMRLRFKLDRPSGKVVLDLEDVSKSYPDKPLFDKTKAQISRGDKIGLLGANGVGKTTLLHMIAELTDYTGDINLGHHVDMSLYSQHQVDSLHLENEILDELAAANPTMTENELRNILGCFLFLGDDVFKKIKILSGGEKSRVALAKILTSSANFLLLDEPTNHLDMISKDILAQALQDYEGSYIMVSHDRDFIRQTANKIWEIQDGRIREYLGTYDEWHRDQVEKTRKESEPKKSNNQKVEKQNSSIKLERDQQKEYKKLQNKYQKVEQRLDELQKEEATLLAKLGDPELYNKPEEWESTEKKYNQVKDELQKTESEYEKLFEQMLEYEG